MRILLAITLTIVLASCSSKEDTLTGKWKLVNIDYSEFFKNAPEEVRGVIEAKMAEELERIKDKTFFTFHDDKKLVLEAPNYLGKVVGQKGSWRTNASMDSVYFDLEYPESYKIVELSSEKLILRTDEMPIRILHLVPSE
jgi:hypothetical protein